MSNLATVETSSMRTAPVIRPESVMLNSAGFAFREVFVRLPEGAILDDLKESSIWKLVQTGNNALRKFDKLTIVEFDEKWIAEAIVSEANHTMVSISKPRKTDFPERFEKLFSDGTYRVVWTGAGYQVERIRDSTRMGDVFPNAAIAERALINMYPRK
jgi:hypothetical protein